MNLREIEIEIKPQLFTILRASKMAKAGKRRMERTLMTQQNVGAILLFDDLV